MNIHYALSPCFARKFHGTLYNIFTEYLSYTRAFIMVGLLFLSVKKHATEYSIYRWLHLLGQLGTSSASAPFTSQIQVWSSLPPGAWHWIPWNDPKEHNMHHRPSPKRPSIIRSSPDEQLRGIWGERVRRAFVSPKCHRDGENIYCHVLSFFCTSCKLSWPDVPLNVHSCLRRSWQVIELSVSCS